MDQHVETVPSDAYRVSAYMAIPKQQAGRRRAPRSWLIAAATVMILAGGAGAAWLISRTSGEASYVTAVVDRGAITRTIVATGMVNPLLTVTVGSYVSGVIQEVLCDFNTQVTKARFAPGSIPVRSRRRSIKARRILTSRRRSWTRTMLASHTHSSTIRETRSSRKSRPSHKTSLITRKAHRTRHKPKSPSTRQPLSSVKPH
jgi:hypothetical protein